MTDFASFLRWEAASRDSIDFKKTYVDIAGDLNAGLMLSELLYWYLPSQGSDNNKLRVQRDGFQWVAVRRYQWWERTRLSPDQSDRALNILCGKGLVLKKRYKFAGEVTVHVRIIETAFLAAWEKVLNSPIVNPFLPKPEMELGKKAKSKTVKKQKGIKDNTEILLTETPTLITPEIPIEKPANAFILMKEAIRKAHEWTKPTDQEWGQIQKAASQLVKVDITPADIPSLYAFCRSESYGKTFTPLFLSGKASEWKKQRPLQVVPETELVILPKPTEATDDIISPEQVEEMKRLNAMMMANTNANTKPTDPYGGWKPNKEAV